jgi:hypothetical protein
MNMEHCLHVADAMMTRTPWTPTLAWLAAVSAALALAVIGPNEASLMGRLPVLAAKRPDHQAVLLPQGLPAERTLALVAFQRTQRSEVQSWIDGLRLEEDRTIAWLRMAVLNDPGNEQAREAIEARLSERTSSGTDRSRLVRVFTDRDAFVRAAGLTSAEHAWVLVLNRDGKVLARAEGAFDEDKARALRQTLLAQSLDF